VGQNRKAPVGQNRKAPVGQEEIMKTYICTSKKDGKVYICKAKDKAELLDLYDISDEYFDIKEKK
jgi:hypothetical protein